MDIFLYGTTNIRYLRLDSPMSMERNVKAFQYHHWEKDRICVLPQNIRDESYNAEITACSELTFFVFLRVQYSLPWRPPILPFNIKFCSLYKQLQISSQEGKDHMETRSLFKLQEVFRYYNKESEELLSDQGWKPLSVQKKSCVAVTLCKNAETIRNRKWAQGRKFLELG